MAGHFVSKASIALHVISGRFYLGLVSPPPGEGPDYHFPRNLSVFGCFRPGSGGETFVFFLNVGLQRSWVVLGGSASPDHPMNDPDSPYQTHKLYRLPQVHVISLTRLGRKVETK